MKGRDESSKETRREMTSALGISPVIGIIMLLCHPVCPMRSEKDFLERSWTDSLNETIVHVPLQALRAFQWSRGTAYSFVLDDQVYYVPSPEKQPIRVSTAEGGYLHGTFDWVYNEEIFGRAQVPNGAMRFSKSDKYLAYASRAVNSSKEMIITTYTKGEKYDYNYNLEYPKTGEPRLATFSVSIWSIEEQKSTKMNILLRDNTAFHYLYGVSWVTLYGKELLLTTWANRWQNETSLALCSYENATCSLVCSLSIERNLAKIKQ